MYAREHGCDTIAHGCTGKGNDQVRIEATVATLAPELKVIAPVRDWQMGRDEEIAYAREHGIPVKGGAEDRRTRSTTTSGGARRRGAGSRTWTTLPTTTSSSSSPAPRRRPTSREDVTLGSSAASVALTGERLGLASCSSAPPSRRRHGVGSSTTSRTDRRPEGARHLRGPRRVSSFPPTPSSSSSRHDPPEPVQARPRPPVGLPRLRRAVVGAAADRPRRRRGAR